MGKQMLELIKMATILVVDADLSERALYSQLFQRHNHRVVAMAKSSDAVDCVRLDKPQVVLLSNSQRQFDDDPLVQYVRQMPNDHQPRLVIVTAHGDGSKLPGADLADAIFIKPVNVRDLTGQVTQWLDETSSQG